MRYVALFSHIKSEMRSAFGPYSTISIWMSHTVSAQSPAVSLCHCGGQCSSEQSPQPLPAAHTSPT